MLHVLVCCHCAGTSNDAVGNPFVQHIRLLQHRAILQEGSSALTLLNI